MVCRCLKESKAPFIPLPFTLMFDILRMESVKQMKENEHGKYTEITDEKEVVRVSA